MRNPGKNCGGCRFWSEMVAQSIGCGPMEALCLADGGPMVGKYTGELFSCHGWKANTLGAVDDPPNYGEFVRTAYEREEGPDALKAAVPDPDFDTLPYGGPIYRKEIVE